MWDVFRVSSDKLALCHLELMKKMNDLIRDINKYGDEQVKVHRKVHLWNTNIHPHHALYKSYIVLVYHRTCSYCRLPLRNRMQSQLLKDVNVNCV